METALAKMDSRWSCYRSGCNAPRAKGRYCQIHSAEFSASCSAAHSYRRDHIDDLLDEEDYLWLNRLDDLRPHTRGECGAERPCPWVGCRYHLALELSVTGKIYLLPDWESRPTCALDAADEGPSTLEVVARLLGDMTRERIRQIEGTAILKIRRRNSTVLKEFDQG